jgi:hypothetical protein
VLATIAEVYVVETDGGCGYKLHLRAFEKCAIATGASADDESVGIGNTLLRKGVALKVFHRGKGL